jgi:transcriptional regulator with XRE-family HTH domain
MAQDKTYPVFYNFIMARNNQMNKTGRCIRKARESLGLSQRMLAKKAGLSNATISLAESGVGPGVIAVRKMAPVLGMKPSELMGWKDIQDVDEWVMKSPEK